MLDNILGADVRLVAEGVSQEDVKKKILEELRAQGEVPYLIGRRAVVLGTVAYVGCALEIVAQTGSHGRADRLYLYGIRSRHARGGWRWV